MEQVWSSEDGTIIVYRVFGYLSTRGSTEIHHVGMHFERDGDEGNVAVLALDWAYERRGIDNVESDARHSQGVNGKATAAQSQRNWAGAAGNPIPDRRKRLQIHLCGPVQKLGPARQRSIIGLIKGMKVPIGVGSLASWVRARSARKRMYVENTPVEIAVKMDIMSVINVTIED